MAGTPHAAAHAFGGDPAAERTLLFVHGWQGTRVVWGPAIARLGGRYRALSVDLRGMGATNILRDRKLAMCAQACVDSALWDAVGKALDAPLYKIWGGYTDKLPVTCIATPWL